MDKTQRFAAALRYDTRLPAPFVTASGRGDLARRLLGLAQKFGVPVTNAPELAERLVYLDPGDVIPEELFVPVAKILTFVLDIEDAKRTSIKK